MWWGGGQAGKVGGGGHLGMLYSELLAAARKHSFAPQVDMRYSEPHHCCHPTPPAAPQSNLLEEARTFRDASIVDVKSYEELKAAVAGGVCGAGGGAVSWT